MGQKRVGTLRREERVAAGRIVAQDPAWDVTWRERRDGRLTLEWIRDRDPVVALVSLIGLHEHLEELEAHLVTQLRAEGLSWAEVGGLVGLTRQGAQKHYEGIDQRLREALAAAGHPGAIAARAYDQTPAPAPAGAAFGVPQPRAGA